MIIQRHCLRFFCLLAALLYVCTALNAAEPRHAFSLFGEVKYGPNFQHFDYVNPDAPKGGEVRLAARGNFNSLNPFILTGIPAAGIDMLFDSLMTSSKDEPNTQYGLLAKTITVPADRSWARFSLRSEARFHDGTKVTAEDVVFSFNTLMQDGHPSFKIQFAPVQEVVALDSYTVEFRFNEKNNRELPFIVGGLTVFPKAYYESHPFNQTTLDSPIGSGPYKIKTMEGGRSITYERDPNYWGKDLPVNKGRYNYDTIRVDYYRDFSIILEAFKAGKFDFRHENISKNWATAYTFPAQREGLVKVEEIPHELPSGMQAFAFNVRLPKFQDVRVREALNLVYDYEWVNENLFYGAYERTESYFANTELAATGLPTGDELKILEKYKDQLPDAVFTEEFHAPKTDGSGWPRENLVKAQQLLLDAGYHVDGNQLVDASGKPFTFEILLKDPIFERATLPFIYNLKRLGIKAHIRTIDVAQFIKRVEAFNFEMIIDGWGQSLSPGNEQRNYWTCAAANTRGSANTLGLCDPVVDALVEGVVTAKDRQTLINYTRALDRVLLWGHYIIPNWHIKVFRLAYWDRFSRPEHLAKYDHGFLDTWWVDADKDAHVKQWRAQR